MNLILALCAASLVLAQAAIEKKVVCYWGSWSVFRTGNGKFDISYLDPKLCTHLIYTFVGLSRDTDEVTSLSAWCDLPDDGGLNNMGRLNNLRQQNPKLKTMVAIGGWNEGSAKFSKAAADPIRRRKFVESAVAFVKKYGFDGLDIDWEYPAQFAGSSPDDRHNYVLLLKELRESFDQEGLLLSAAVAAPESSASISYDIPQISKYLDFINVMAYDLYGSYDYTGMNAALYPGSSESGNDGKLNIDWIINYWLSQAPAEKIVLGVPFYGRSFTLRNPQSHGLGAPSAHGAAGPYTQEGGTLGYNEICEKFQQENWNVEFDEERRVPYAINGNQWVSYDDEKSIKEKANLIKKYNLGGGMVWSIETDDFLGKCGENFPLLKALNSELRNEVFSSSIVSHPKVKAPKILVQHQHKQQKPSYQSPHNKPNYSQQSKPSYLKQEYPQQSAVNNGEVCQADGLVADTSNCAKFYHCQFFDGQFIKYSFDCPSGTLFDARSNTCDHARFVRC